MKDLTKAKYLESREIVRRNVSVNSREVMLKKYNFLNGYTVMGGVVLQKRESNLANHFDRRGAMELNGSPAYGSVRGRIECKTMYRRFQLELFDFSGVFEVMVVGDHLSFEVEERLRKFRKGDMVFVAGQVFFNKAYTKLILFAFWAGFEHELVSRRAAYPEEFQDSEETMNIVKRGGYYRKWERCSNHAKIGIREKRQIKSWTFRDLVMFHPDEAIRSFFRKGRPMEHLHDFLEALYSVYSEQRCSWIPSMIIRYFKKQILRGIENVRNSEVPKQLFLSRFPDIKHLVEWSGNDIQNLTFKKAGKYCRQNAVA